MSSYSFSDDAIQDLDEICEYIARTNPNAASKLFDRIREQCKKEAEDFDFVERLKELNEELEILNVEA